MARIRTIKPELAAHEELFDLERETGLPIRFAWCMLFTVCDREGRFQWRPRTLKAQILPHDDLDFSRVLHAWVTRGFIVKYTVKGEVFGCIPTFTKHQVINNREAPSDLPALDHGTVLEQSLDASSTEESTREARVSDASSTREVHAQAEGREGKEGREGTQESRAPRAQRAPAATRLPDDFELTAERAAIARTENLAPERTFAKFRDYWRAASGANARKLDWDATWRNWCRSEADRLPHNARVAVTRRPKSADELDAEAAHAGH